MDFGEWVWCLLFEALTSPAAWCLVTDRTGPGLRPSQLEPLGRGRVTVTNEPDSDGRVRTVHRLDGRVIDADDLWRFRLYPAAGTPAGLDPIGYAAETIGQALAAQRYGATFFADSAIPSMALLERPEHLLGAGPRGKGDVGAAHKGRRGTAVLGAGLKPTALTVPPEASMFLETQRFGLQSVARYFGVPPEMIGSDSGNPKTYASLEMRNQDFLTFGVGPKIARLETALNGLLPRGQFAKFNAGALLRTDLKSRYESYAIGLRAGFLTVDECARSRTASLSTSPPPPPDRRWRWPQDRPTRPADLPPQTRLHRGSPHHRVRRPCRQPLARTPDRLVNPQTRQDATPLPQHRHQDRRPHPARRHPSRRRDPSRDHRSQTGSCEERRWRSPPTPPGSRGITGWSSARRSVSGAASGSACIRYRRGWSDRGRCGRRCKESGG